MPIAQYILYFCF